MSIFGKKSGSSFSSAPVFGPVAKRNANAKQLFTFEGSDGKAGFDGKHIKATWSGDTLEVNTDQQALTLPIAEAMVAEIAKAIRENTPPIKESTRKYRESVKRAYARGAKWARDRYKDRVPGDAGSDRAFNDSGHLVAGVKPTANAKGFSVVTHVTSTRNRFVVQAMLRRYVPKLAEMNMKAAIGRMFSTLVQRKKGREFGKGRAGGARISGRK